MTIYYYRVRRLQSSNLMRIPLEQVGPSWRPGDAPGRRSAADGQPRFRYASAEVAGTAADDHDSSAAGPAAAHLSGRCAARRLPLRLVRPVLPHAGRGPRLVGQISGLNCAAVQRRCHAGRRDLRLCIRTPRRRAAGCWRRA